VLCDEAAAAVWPAVSPWAWWWSEDPMFGRIGRHGRASWCRRSGTCATWWSASASWRGNCTSCRTGCGISTSVMSSARTGVAPPVQGGARLSREVDRAVRPEIAEQIGHPRTTITSAILAGR